MRCSRDGGPVQPPIHHPPLLPSTFRFGFGARPCRRATPAQKSKPIASFILVCDRANAAPSTPVKNPLKSRVARRSRIRWIISRQPEAPWRCGIPQMESVFAVRSRVGSEIEISLARARARDLQREPRCVLNTFQRCNSTSARVTLRVVPSMYILCDLSPYGLVTLRSLREIIRSTGRATRPARGLRTKSRTDVPR